MPMHCLMMSAGVLGLQGMQEWDLWKTDSVCRNVLNQKDVLKKLSLNILARKQLLPVPWLLFLQIILAGCSYSSRLSSDAFVKYFWEEVTQENLSDQDSIHHLPGYHWSLRDFRSLSTFLNYSVSNQHSNSNESFVEMMSLKCSGFYLYLIFVLEFNSMLLCLCRPLLGLMLSSVDWGRVTTLTCSKGISCQSQ